MRKKWKAAALLFVVLGILAGCGKSNIGITDLTNSEVEKYVTLPDYKNLEIQAGEKFEITDDYVKSYLNSRVDAVSSMHELTGTVENGDVVNIDYAGTIDGTAFEGGTAQGQLLEIGSGSFIAGFEDGLIGANVGDTKELDLQFPDNYGHAEYAGKECVFVVKINYILAALTDENVSQVDAGYQSAEAYREDAKTMLMGLADDQYERTLKNSIATTLVTASTYGEIPQSLVEDYRTSLQTDYENVAAQAGMSMEEYMTSNFGIPADSVAEEMDKVALRCAKEGLALQAIANAEEISVSDEELDAAIADYTAAGAVEEDLDRETVRVNLLYEKVYDFLVEVYGE